MESRKLLVGGFLFALGIASYLLLGLYTLKYSMPSDVSWFHVYVAEYAGYPFDKALSVISPLDLRRYDVLGDLLLRQLGFKQLDIASIVSGILLLVFAGVLSYYWSRDFYATGLAVLLIATTPGFIYWFKQGMLGPWLYIPLVLLGVLLASMAYERRNLALSVLAGLILGLSWILNGSTWVVLVAYSIALSVLVIAGKPGWVEFSPSLVIILTLASAIVLGYRYITFWHLLAVGFLAGSIAGWLVSERLGLGRASLKLIAVVSALISSVAVFALLGLVFETPGVGDVYYKQYNPMFDLGVPGLLLVLAFLALLRSARGLPAPESFTRAILLAASIIAIILGYVSVVAELYAIVFSSILAAFVVVRLLEGVRLFKGGLSRVSSLLLSLLILSALIGGNAVSSRAVSLSLPSIISLDIPLTYLNSTAAGYSGLPQLLASISNSNATQGVSLVVVYWGYSHYVLGYTGRGFVTLAGPAGPAEGWRLTSWIMISDEATAAGIIRRLMLEYNITRAYVIVGEAISVEHTLYGSNQTHLGRAVLVNYQTGTVTYQPLGDIARIPMYVALSNQSLTDYIDYSKATYFTNAPLAWTGRAASSLVAELTTYAASSLKYPVSNDIYSPQALNPGPLRFFRLVNTTLIPLDTVVGTASVYNNYYLLAVYQFSEVAL
ncbi:MAG: hypothetical protein JHC12_02735 [Thermogladius sp.]|nr:hypothetical protein [Thermogladius sp.]